MKRKLFIVGALFVSLFIISCKNEAEKQVEVEEKKRRAERIVAKGKNFFW